MRCRSRNSVLLQYPKELENVSKYLVLKTSKLAIHLSSKKISLQLHYTSNYLCTTKPKTSVAYGANSQSNHQQKPTILLVSPAWQIQSRKTLVKLSTAKSQSSSTGKTATWISDILVVISKSPHQSEYRTLERTGYSTPQQISISFPADISFEVLNLTGGLIQHGNISIWVIWGVLSSGNWVLV